MSAAAASPRLRFCPAPSGWLHVGGARTALFNWLWTRRHGGAFVLRIEDTHAERATLASAEGMMDALAWLGLDWDEGPALGAHAERGEHGPYLQSARLPLHREVARLLVEAGSAYEAFETPEELEAARAAGDGYVVKGGLLAPAEREARRAAGQVPAVRLATPAEGSVAFEDAVRGTVTYDWAEVSDPVLQRADGSPTYMLANVVDDLAQGIGVVARGEDLLAATPRQVLLTDVLLPTGVLDAALAAVGYPPRPEGAPERLGYAHLPLLVGADRKPLSTRHGSVAVDEFRRQGFTPEVLRSFLALCGWSPGGDRDRLEEAELIAAFSFDRVQRNPAYFDVDKLRSFNGDRIRELDVQDLAARLEPYLADAALVDEPASPEHRALLAGLAPLVQERIQTLTEAVPLVAFAFRDEVEHDEAAVRKWLKGPAGDVLDRFAAALAAEEVPWDADAIQAWCEEVAAELEVGLGKVMQPLRVAVTGTAVSPPLPQTLAVLDRDVVLARVLAARPLAAS